MSCYVALLRGINVGGNNLIKMKDLKACFERGVLYFSRLIGRASQSFLSRLVSTPVYQSMTIRNWNTTTKLLGLMEAVEEQAR